MEMLEKRKKIRETSRGLFWFLIMVGVIIALLAVANWMPSVMHEDYAQKYESIEDAKRALGLDSVLVPTYFPEGISWPPSLIFAQKKPYKAVVMEFKGTEEKETVLIIIQSSLQGSDAKLQRIVLTEPREKTEYRLKEKTAILQVGMCNNGMSCSRMTWQENKLHHTVLLMSSPFELIKIAESMIH
jgi:hypothetical protein